MNTLFSRTTLLVALISLSTTAAAVFEIEPLDLTFNQIALGSTGVINYEIQNELNTNLDPGTKVVSLPGGITQITASGMCGTIPVTTTSQTCGSTFALGPRGSANDTCVLQLCVQANNIGNGTVGQSANGGPEVCEYPSVPANCNTPEPKDALNVTVNSLAASIPIVVTSPTPPNPAVVSPGSTYSWTIQNNSGAQIALNISANVPSAILSRITGGAASISICPSVAAGATCTITTGVVTAGTDVNPVGNVVTFQGTNTGIATLNAGILNGATLALQSAANITAVATPTPLIFKNTSATTSIIITSVTVSTLPTGVSFVSGSDTCTGQTIAPLATCSLSYQATTSVASGTATSATVNYVEESVLETLNVTNPVTVAATTVTISPNPINVPFGNTVTATLTNGGAFTWQGVGAEYLNPTPYVEVVADTCASVSTIAPGGSCALTFELTQAPSGPVIAGSLVAVGTNITSTPATVNLANGVTIAKCTAASQHLQYQCLTITNPTSQAITLNSVSLTTNLSLVQYCQNGTTTCPAAFTSTCVNTIGAASNCNLYFQGQNPTVLNAQPFGSNTGNITLNLSTGSPSTPTLLQYNLVQQVGLFATGSFTNAGSGSPNASNIAFYNGTAWSALGTATTAGLTGGVGSALAFYNGDLYVGGAFTAVNSTGTAVANTANIAFWNGATWNSLTSTPLAGAVNALAVTPTTGNYFTNKLILGGTFTSPAQSLAMWNGTSLTTIGTAPVITLPAATIVNALAVTTDTVYVGGSFAATVPASGTIANLAQIVGSTGAPTWSATNLFSSRGTNGVVNSLLLNTYNNQLYVGGAFTTALNAAALTVNRVALYDFNAVVSPWWSILGPVAGPGFGNGNVLALIQQQGSLYAGGSFTLANALAVNPVTSFDPATPQWRNVGTAATIAGTVNTLVNYNSNIYAGGITTLPSGNIAVFNGTSWSTFGGGITGTVAPSVNDILIGTTIQLTP